MQKILPRGVYLTKGQFRVIICVMSSLLIIAIYTVYRGRFSTQECVSINARTLMKHAHRKEPVAGETRNDDWQMVTNEGDIFVYSAYYESNFKDRIRIIGATTSTMKKELYCVLLYDGIKQTYSVTKAFVVYINEGHYKRFTAAFFVCKHCGLTIPSRVSLTDKSHLRYPLNILTVHDQTYGHPRFAITACISPVHTPSSIGSTERIIEWIETNILLGVNYFTFYVYNVSESLSHVLHYYESEGILEILPWSLREDDRYTDMLNPNEIHYLGQLAALNDCLYRNKGRTTFTTSMDLDELIIPQIDSDFTLKEMLNRLPNENVYLFRHSYFKTDSTQVHRTTQHGVKLLMTNKIERENQIRAAYDRSKLMFKPSEVVTLGIHSIWSLISGREYIVDPEIGKLHHYKSESEMDNIPTFVTDRAAEKYNEGVLAKVNKTIFDLKHKRYI